MVLIVQGQAFQLTSEDGVSVKKQELHHLRSNQEESDTRILLYAAFGCSQEYPNIRVRSPDTDVFFIMLHHAANVNCELFFDTGKGNNKRLLNVSQIAKGYGQMYSSALMVLHAFTGCDSTSAFKGIGKIKPIKILEKKKHFQNVLAVVGDSWEMSPTLLEVFEEFTCCMYGFPRFSSLDMLRYHLLKKKCVENDQLDPKRTVDLSIFPPCQETLKQHLKRTIYQVGIWKRAFEQFPEVPDPEDNGWVKETGVLEPLWCDGEILPLCLADLVKDDSDTEEECLEEESDSDSDNTDVEF